MNKQNKIYLIFIIFFSIFFLFSIWCNIYQRVTIERLGDKGMFNEGYEMYRLGDMVKGKINEKKEYQKGKYKNTIAGLYLEKTKNLAINQRYFNYKILDQIIQQKKKENNFILPSKEDIVIHLRVGDIMKLDKNNNIGCDRSYCTSFKEINNIINKFHNKKLYFVYGVHHKINAYGKKNNNMFITHLYLNKIKEILNSKKNKL